MIRTFNNGPHIWFILHFDDQGVMTALEEHDWREGGHINKNVGKSWEQTFVEEAVNRCSGEEYKAKVRKLAEDFLVSDVKDIDISKTDTVEKRITNYADANFKELEEGMVKLKEAVKLRDQMGGAMYYNILNDDCCAIANKLLTLEGANKSEISKILGEGNYILS